MKMRLSGAGAMSESDKLFRKGIIWMVLLAVFGILLWVGTVFLINHYVKSGQLTEDITSIGIAVKGIAKDIKEAE